MWQHQQGDMHSPVAPPAPLCVGCVRGYLMMGIAVVHINTQQYVHQHTAICTQYSSHPHCATTTITVLQPQSLYYNHNHCATTTITVNMHTTKPTTIIDKQKPSYHAQTAAHYLAYMPLAPMQLISMLLYTMVLCLLPFLLSFRLLLQWHWWCFHWL